MLATVPVFAALLLFVSPATAVINLVTVINRCSFSIEPIVRAVGGNPGSLGAFLPGTTRTFPVAETFNGFLYNKGTGTNQQDGATQVYMQLAGGYYAIVVDKYGFDNGIGVTVNSPAMDGYCDSAICTGPTCADAWRNINGPVKIIDGQLPGGWVHQCAAGNTMTVTFCPPTPPLDPVIVQLHPNGNNAKCIDVKANTRENGTPVQMYDCNGSAAQNWALSKGDANLRLAGTNFCLDAGTAGTSGSALKIWQCYDGLPAQTFFYTDDHRLAQANHQCVDLPSGDTTNGRVLQTWQCTGNNVYQVWTT